MPRHEAFNLSITERAAAFRARNKLGQAIADGKSVNITFTDSKGEVRNLDARPDAILSMKSGERVTLEVTEGDERIWKSAMLHRVSKVIL